MDQAFKVESNLTELLVLAVISTKVLDKQLRRKHLFDQFNILLALRVLTDDYHELETHEEGLQWQQLLPEAHIFLRHGLSLGWRLVTGCQLHLDALFDCLGDELCEKLALGKRLPTLTVDIGLILVVLLVVAHDIVAVWIVFVELIVGGLLGTFLVFKDDIVRVEHGFVLALLIQPKLLLSSTICLLRAQFNHGLGEFVRFQVFGVRGFLYLVNCRVRSLSEEHVHHLPAQVPSKHVLDSFKAFFLGAILEDFLRRRHQEAGFGNGYLDKFEK